MLLRKFESEIWRKVPHMREGGVVNATPLLNLTDALKECARLEYGIDLSERQFEILGKLESHIAGGSIKVRPAVQIIGDAIASGRLKRGQTIFEATSGNFGIALGLLADLGLNVVALVSRKLQKGVFEELRNGKVKTLNLDIDICPAPGFEIDQNLLVAKGVASNVREQLAQLGLDVSIFDNSRGEVEKLLVRQDIINLAKLLAKVYGGFCPEQYDNELNVEVHESVTAPEIDQQIEALGYSLADFKLVCTFGTGGTSGGLSRYVEKRYGRKSVHVVFPLINQDVAGIRTKDKALGLKFYELERYAGQHEVDFEASRRLLRFFLEKGYDVGESSALALYAVLQMVNYGAGDRFVVILADGIQKYRRGMRVKAEVNGKLEVTLQEASTNPVGYSSILWAHTMFTPQEEGIGLVASSLGCDKSKVRVVRTRDVESLVTTQEIPEGLRDLLPDDNTKLLLVCVSGSVSRRVAEVLRGKGIRAESLAGGIMNLSATKGEESSRLVQLAI